VRQLARGHQKIVAWNWLPNLKPVLRVALHIWKKVHVKLKKFHLEWICN